MALGFWGKSRAVGCASEFNVNVRSPPFARRIGLSKTIIVIDFPF